MGKTTYHIQGADFLINGAKTYSEIPDSDPRTHGLLFNARFIQGVFADKNPANAGKYDRFGKTFDPDSHTQELVAALPAWYATGLRALTIGLQGGGPILTYEDWSVIDSGCFSSDGKSMDEGYKARLEAVIKACDELGMLVIVSILYQAQAHLFDNDVCLARAVQTACEYLRDFPYENIIIEVANEHDVGDFVNHPLVGTPQGIAHLICMAKEWCGGRFAVGSSGGGGSYHPLVGKYSDVVLVHGNTLRRQEYYDFIRRVQADCGTKPIICNEDSPMFSQLAVCLATHTSWGYYNNHTKQEPPAFWQITRGEDEYFATRLLGLINGKPAGENEVYLQGFEDNTDINGGRYLRVASLYPERVDHVEFYEDDRLLYIAFDEPFLLYTLTTWEQKPYFPAPGATVFRAVVHYHNGVTEVLTHTL